MTEDERIKLAEAMGWTCHATGNAKGRVWMPPDFGDSYDERDAVIAPCLPDPENDANDDYAVLEWVRTNWKLGSGENYRFREIFTDPGFSPDGCANMSVCYKIGDYARAVLKVLETS